MNGVDALLRTIDGDILDRPVWTADISYWISGRAAAGVDTQAGLAGTVDTWSSESGYLDLCDQLGCMPYYWYDAFWAHDRIFPSGTISGESAGEEQRTTWRIGNRTLKQIVHFSTTSWSQAIVKYAVTCTDDLKTLIELIEASHLEPSAALSEYRVRREQWVSYGGLPSLGLPRSPVSAFINEWAGVLNGSLLLADEPELCNRLFALLADQERPILERCASESVPLIHFPDNLTSDVYTSLFDEHMREYYTCRLDTLHDTDIKAAVHLDGTVRGMLPKLVSVGMDAVEAVTPIPVGDISVSEMKAIASAGNTVLWGGVPGAMFAPPYTWETMKNHVEHVLEAWRDRPFVLGVADQVPPDGDISFIRGISDIIGLD